MTERSFVTLLIVFALAALSTAGCGNEVDSLSALDEELAEWPPLSELPSGHHVTGRLILEGEPPEPTIVRLISDAACHVRGAGPRAANDVVIGPNGEVANVFVWITDFQGRYAPPEEEVVLDQENCEYEPRVFGIMVGQPLLIRNSDDTLHNVRLDSEENRRFNLGQPRKGMETTKSFTHEEVMVNFECDVHPWMDAWGGVLHHPFYAVSGGDGSFTIEGVPEGDWTLGWWHERLGSGTTPIEVADDDVELGVVRIEGERAP